MIPLLFRLLFIYLFTLLACRLMGKRQIGELQLSELVSAFFLSELATFCVTDPNIPLVFSILPMLTVILLEIIVSFLSTRFPFVKKAIDNPPSFLMIHGKINETELDRNRVTLGELMSQIRQSGIGDIRDVNYAILESNGKISVIPKDDRQAPKLEDMNLPAKATGISHAVIVNGKTVPQALRQLNWNGRHLEKILKENKLKKPEDLLLFTVDDNGEIYYQKKEKL